MELLFWLSLGFICYTYAVYPVLLWLLARIAPKPVGKKPSAPAVSVVMSALDEEGRIAARLDNLLGQQYPADKLEVVVVSDGSTDRTADIIRSYAGRNVRLIELTQRGGKALAVNRGVAEANGEIIVFADARQRFEPDVVAQLAANFSDKSVGCVSGELILLQNEESSIQAEMGAYWKYEKWIRKAESRTGSVVGATGAIYAIRRELYRPLPQGTLLDDVLTPLTVVMQGKRCTFDGTAVAYDKVSKDASQEWTRKVRTLAGNWQLLSLCPRLALPLANPLWWRFMSHKISRLLVPFAMLGTLLASLLIPEPFYRFMLTCQVAFYIAVAVAALVPQARSVKVLNLSYFFLVMNGAAVAGFWRWITGGSQSAWAPAHGENTGELKR